MIRTHIRKTIKSKDYDTEKKTNNKNKNHMLLSTSEIFLLSFFCACEVKGMQCT